MTIRPVLPMRERKKLGRPIRLTGGRPAETHRSHAATRAASRTARSAAPTIVACRHIRPTWAVRARQGKSASRACAPTCRRMTQAVARARRHLLCAQALLASDRLLAGMDVRATASTGPIVTPTMGPGTCVCTPVAETCDGKDDNCDGVIDEEPGAGAACTTTSGFPSACVDAGCECLETCDGGCVNLAGDPNNCGACGKACLPDCSSAPAPSASAAARFVRFRTVAWVMQATSCRTAGRTGRRLHASIRRSTPTTAAGVASLARTPAPAGACRRCSPRSGRTPTPPPQRERLL